MPRLHDEPTDQARQVCSDIEAARPANEILRIHETRPCHVFLAPLTQRPRNPPRTPGIVSRSVAPSNDAPRRLTSADGPPRHRVASLADILGR